jgi:hypothetical protein
MTVAFKVHMERVYVALCPQPQKVRQYGGRFGRFDLHRDDWTDQSYRILLP